MDILPLCFLVMVRATPNAYGGHYLEDALVYSNATVLLAKPPREPKLNGKTDNVMDQNRKYVSPATNEEDPAFEPVTSFLMGDKYWVWVSADFDYAL